LILSSVYFVLTIENTEKNEMSAFQDRFFQKQPRAYADDLVAEGIVDAKDMLSKCLSWMSADDVREMLDANELSPRFDEEVD
jgi:hypothetical protein